MKERGDSGEERPKASQLLSCAGRAISIWQKLEVGRFESEVGAMAKTKTPVALSSRGWLFLSCSSNRVRPRTPR